MSTRARLCIREVARELEEDMELGAKGISTPPRPPQLASHRRALSLIVVTVVLSVAVVIAVVTAVVCHPLI